MRKTIWLQCIFAGLLIALMGWYAIGQMEKRLGHELETSLKTDLETTHNAIHIWMSSNIRDAQFLARSPELIETARRLLTLDREPKTLRLADQQQLREAFQPFMLTRHYESLNLVGPDNIILAASEDRDIGRRHLLHDRQPAMLDRLWHGESVMGHPLRITSLGRDDALMDDVVMFVGAPILDTEGGVMALLVLQLDPDRRFFPTVSLSRRGRTGESFAFNREGYLLSESRFPQTDDALAVEGDLGALPAIPLRRRSDDTHHATSPENFRQEEQHPAAPALTKGMSLAITQGQGSDLQGYRNRRGVSVVGAWLWLDSMDMGLIVEQNVNEAYGSLKIVRGFILAMSVFAISVLFILVLVTDRRKKKMLDTEAQLKAIVNTATDGILVLDKIGFIISANPAMCRIFGYSHEELVGNCISMPIPGLADDGANVDAGPGIDPRRISGHTRSLRGLRKNGDTFPLELSLGEVRVNAEIHYTGILRDVSERVQAEEQLRKSTAELAMLAEVVQRIDSAVLITDTERKVIWVNDGFTRISEYSLSDVIGRKLWETLHGPETDRATARDIQEQLQRNRRAEAQLVNYTKSGRPYWVDLVVTPILDEAGRVSQYVIVEHDITVYKRLNQELQMAKEHAEQAASKMARNEQKLLLALSGAGAGSWFMNLKTGKMQWDKRSCEIFEVMEDAYPRDFAELAAYARSHEQSDLIEGFNRAIRNVSMPTFELGFRIHLGKGVMKIIRAAGSIERDDRGEATTVSGLFFDETQRKQVELDLELAKNEAEAASQAKSSFLAAMSHEIRTPMNGVVGMIDVMSQTSLSDEQCDILTTIKDSAFSLLAIIDDILDFSKIEAGKLSLENIPVNLERILEGVGETLLPMARRKGIELLIYCSPNLPEAVYGDSVRLRQILFNLAGNAIKFTEGGDNSTGEVVVSIRLKRDENQRMSVEFQVKDNGIGMSPDVQSCLFKPFVQGETTTTRRFGGTGLGLAICQHLLQLMGGHIEVQSQEGKGSTFTVMLDFDVVKTANATAATPLQEASILLVNARPSVSNILAAYLRHQGARVTVLDTIANADQQTKDTLCNARYPVLIHDCHGYYNDEMPLDPRITGFTRNLNLPILFLTRGKRRKPRFEREHILSLDLDAMRRLSIIEAVLAAMGRVSLEMPVKTPAQAENKVHFDAALAAGKRLLVAEDNPTNQKVLLHQLAKLGFTAEVADNGVMAMEKWAQGEYDLVLTDCHMPEMDGYDLARAIRQRETADHRVPIIAITADALRGTQQACLEAGMDDYLAKPIQLTLLGRTLDKWLRMEKTAVTIAPAVAAKGTDPVVDAQTLKELLGVDDAAVLASFYQEFINTADQCLADLHAAYQQQDAARLGAAGHKFKSSAQAVGALRLAGCCLMLEQAGKARDWAVIDREMALLDACYDAVDEWIARFCRDAGITPTETH